MLNINKFSGVCTRWARQYSTSNPGPDKKMERIAKATLIYLAGDLITFSVYRYKRAEWIERSFINRPYANDITPWGVKPNPRFDSPYVRESKRSLWKCPLVAAAWPLTIIPVTLMDPEDSFKNPLTSWLFY